MFKTLMISVWLFYLITNLINKFLKLYNGTESIYHACTTYEIASLRIN